MAKVINKDEPVIIAGAGLVGALLSCYLAQQGFKVEMYERRPDMRKTNISAGRSINLALSTRGITALAEVGLADEVMQIAIPMRGRMLHAVDGKLTFQPYSKDQKKAIFSVSRGELNCRLMTLAEKRPNVHIYFDQRVEHMNMATGEITLMDQNQRSRVIKGQTVLGADGAFSAVRDSLMRQPRVNYSQSYLEHGYKELTIPPAENGGHRLDKNCLHIWPRGAYMMIALPNLDGSFTVTCFFPYAGSGGFDFLDAADDATVLAFFKTHFPDAVPVMPTLLHDWRTNPTSSLVTVHCWPWIFEDKCCLFGDAAHAIVPFFGQGMNAGFEDCRIFNNCLQKYKDWHSVFQDYQKQRKENTDAIAQMALENFVEMRDTVADARFLFLKQVQHLLGNEFPEKFLSRYEMVSFSNIPYKEAVRLGAITDQIAHELMQGKNSIEQIDLKKAKQIIDTLLEGAKF